MRFYILREFDQAWQQHLRDLEFLRENVGFQSYSQKDPFQEWTIQSNELFTKLSAKVYRNSAISWLSLDASGIVARPAAPVAPASPVVSDDDGSTQAAAQARGAAPLNATINRKVAATGERRAKKKGGGRAAAGRHRPPAPLSTVFCLRPRARAWSRGGSSGQRPPSSIRRRPPVMRPTHGTTRRAFVGDPPRTLLCEGSGVKSFFLLASVFRPLANSILRRPGRSSRACAKRKRGARHHSALGR